MSAYMCVSLTVVLLSAESGGGGERAQVLPHEKCCNC